MEYRRKLLLLSSLTAFLALAYVLTLVLDPERRGRRSDAYVWLESRLRDSIDRIDIQGAGSPEVLSLLRKNGSWMLSRDAGGEYPALEYPVREARVNDLLDELSRRDSYPRRSSSASAHGRFGLEEGQAARLTLRGGAGLPLLELLVGNSDAGGDIFLRKAGNNEVRSGKDRLSSYLDGQAGPWLNLRLFPESEDNRITAESVQRLRVLAPAEKTETGDGGSPAAPLPVLISRQQNSWRITAGDLSLEPEDIEKTRVDSYITGILNTTGDDFVSPVLPPETAFISLELADGRVLTLRLSPAGDSDPWRAAVSGSPYGYALASWAVDRLFREPEYFRRSGDSGR
jgi:hypothetical protein